jgi:hypothetical protein
LTANPDEEPNIFSPSFSGEPTQIMRRNSSNTWVLIVFIFAEFLSSYLLSIQHEYYLFVTSNSGVEELAFLSQTGRKL